VSTSSKERTRIPSFDPDDINNNAAAFVSPFSQSLGPVANPELIAASSPGIALRLLHIHLWEISFRLDSPRAYYV